VSPSSTTPYTLYAKTDKGCVAAVTDAAVVTMNPLPTDLSLTPSMTTICAGQTVTLTASATGGVSYSLDGSSWQPEENFNVTPQPDVHYTLYVKTAAGCTTSLDNAATVTVKPVPIITLASGTASQIADINTAITTVIYTASDAATITCTGCTFPSNITSTAAGSSFTISGTPSATGTFGYSLTAAASNGCTSAAAAGTIRVVTTPPCAASTQTWTFGAQRWSDKLECTPSNCASTLSLSDEYPPPPDLAAQYAVSAGRYYYNWLCVDVARSDMCPSPWRVPTQTDLNTLRSNTTPSALASIWGYGGVLTGSTIDNESSRGYYWSSTESTSISIAAMHMQVISSDTYLYIGAMNKGFGAQVRCVRN
jgi:hypothetical protein